MDPEDFDSDILNELLELSQAAEHNLDEQKCSAQQELKPGTEHLEVLSKYFGHKNFRPMQWEIISTIIKDRRDVCAIMCTGYGKSLCFQYPSTFMSGVTLVISPLISLMEDQILSLKVSNIPACLLGSAQKNQAKVVSDIFDNLYTLVYLTPEFCTGDYGTDILKRMSKELNITLIAVDEAHCISSWGHDFRYTYRRLGSLHDLFPDVPIMAVTATATSKVRQDIIKSLKLRNPLLVVSGFNRPNLYFEVHQKSSNGIISDLRKVMVYHNSQWQFSGPTIIYCITRKQTEEISQILKIEGINCTLYHAGLPLNTRREAHELFVKDKIGVIVATIAFGMGIDKPDIRCVIHYGSSKSIESYYQEVGRAGRDGLPAKCITFYSQSDFVILRNLGDMSPQTSSNLEHIKNYVDTRQCRRRFILDYFDDKVDVPKEAQKSCCDNCTKRLCDGRKDQEKYEGLDENGCYDFTKYAKIMLEAVSVSKRYGLNMYVLFIRGSNSTKLPQIMKTHALHGCGKQHSDEWWKVIGKMLIQEKYLLETFIKTNPKQRFSFPVLDITEKGRQLLQRLEANEKLLLPPPSTILSLLKTKSQTESSSGWLTTKPKDEATTSKPEIKSESTDNLELYHKLLDKRSEIATELNCMPYMVASNTALMKMSQCKPLTLDQMRMLKFDGFTEVKILKFGNKFLNVINGSSQVQESKKLSIMEILLRHPLPDNPKIALGAEVSCTLFKSGLTVGEIAAKRSVTTATIASHLISGMKIGHSIRMVDLGVTDEYRDIIIKIIHKHYPDLQDVQKKVIKEDCPPEITYEHIGAVLAYMQVRTHLKSLNILYEEFEDFQFNEVIAKRNDSENNDKLDMLIKFGNEVKDDGDSDDTVIWDDLLEPPSKRDKTETYDMILDSPPPSATAIEHVKESHCEEVTCNDVQSDVQSSPTTKTNTKLNVTKSRKKTLPPWLLTKKIN